MYVLPKQNYLVLIKVGVPLVGTNRTLAHSAIIAVIATPEFGLGNTSILTLESIDFSSVF